MKYVALLRGINVGGNNKINMVELVGTFEAAGFTGVSTYINSGNVIFSDDSLATQSAIALLIEAAIERDYNLKIPVLVRNNLQFEQLMGILPTDWANDSEQKCNVMFLWDEIDSEEILSVLPIKPVDTVLYAKGAVLWRAAKNDSALSGQIDLVKSKQYKKMTVRNVNTVRKISGLLNQ